MRFNSPDSISPFGRGGINVYSYCGGDPINRFDPNGRNWQALIKLFNTNIAKNTSRTGMSPHTRNAIKTTRKRMKAWPLTERATELNQTPEKYLVNYLKQVSNLEPSDYPNFNNIPNIKPSEFKGAVAGAYKKIANIKYKLSIKYDLRDIQNITYIDDVFKRHNNAISQQNDFISQLKSKFAPPAYDEFAQPSYFDSAKDIRT